MLKRTAKGTGNRTKRTQKTSSYESVKERFMDVGYERF